MIESRIPNNRLIPAGGTDEQVLKKSADTDYATEWADDVTGGGNGGGGSGTANLGLRAAVFPTTGLITRFLQNVSSADTN